MTDGRRDILIIMGRYLPGYKDGGPVRSIKNLTDFLGKEYNFKILTCDRDHGDTETYPNIKVNGWNRVGNAEVYYVPPKGFSQKLIVELAGRVDLVYVCGCFNDYTAYQILTILIPLLTTPYLSRVLHADGIGQYSYSYAIAYYFVLFSMLGVNNYGNRSIAKVRDKKEELSRTFLCIYTIQLMSTILCSLAYIIYAVFFSNSQMAIIMIFYVVSAGLDINWLFWGLEEFKLTVTRNVVIKLMTTTAIFLFVKNASDVYLYGAIMVAGILVSQVILWPFAKKQVDFTETKKIHISDIVIHIKPNLKLFIPTVAVSVYKIMDKIMLGAMTEEVQVGFYESADKIITIPICVVTSLGTVMLPRMANLMTKKDNKDGVQNLILKSIVFAVFLTAPISFGIMSIAKEFVPLFYGIEFEPCIQLFYTLLPSCIFVAIANVIRTQYLIPAGFDKEYILSCVIGAVVNLIINVSLIPKFASLGAAIGTLIAEFSVLLYQFWVTRKVIYYSKILPRILFSLIAAALMAIIVCKVPIISNSLVQTIAVKVLLGIILYLVLSVLFYFLRKNAQVISSEK